MNKELECLKRLIYVIGVLQETINKVEEKAGTDASVDVMTQSNKDGEIIEQALQRLESIDSANPSEALECLERIDDVFYLNKYRTTDGGNREEYEFYPSDTKEYDIIKQALMERIVWKNIHNTKVKIPLCDVFNNPVPLSKEERHKYIEHIYYHWEEMKEALEDKISSLRKELEQALIQAENDKEKIKILKEKHKERLTALENLEKTKSKKELAWDIAIKKNVNLRSLKRSETVEDYNILWTTDVLTEEEFNLLKNEIKVYGGNAETEKEEESEDE